MDPPQTIGIDPSVSDLFPPAVLVERLENVDRVATIVRENLRRLKAGESLANRVV